MALKGSLPKRLLILAEELCLIPAESGGPMESVLALLSDCFSVQICNFAGYFDRFVFDQENAVIVYNGQINKGHFIGHFLCVHNFEGQDKVSFIWVQN